MKMKIEIWTDIMCPYCYIGKAHYEAALKQFGHADEVEIEWKAYVLNPDLPGQGKGIPLEKYLSETAGLTEEKIEAMFRGVKQLADDAGLKFNLRNAIAANTQDAHMLVKMASRIGKSSWVLGQLSKAYFEEGKDYSDPDLLISIGKEAGLKEEDIRHMFDCDDYKYEIKQNMQEAANLGFDTVPTFLMDRRQAIIGSEPVELFLKVFNKAYNAWKNRTQKEDATEVTRGKSCTSDGVCEI